VLDALEETIDLDARNAKLSGFLRGVDRGWAAWRPSWSSLGTAP
jgi:hypothetical protein